MKSFEYKQVPHMCEQPSIALDVSGTCGGDAGHGGYAFIKLSMVHGGNGFVVSSETDYGTEETEEVREVTISVLGDWELEGMAVAFLELGRALLARDDVLEARERWSDRDCCT